MTIYRVSLKTLCAIVALSAVAIALYSVLFPELPKEFTPEYNTLDQTKQNPPCSLCWFSDSNNRPVAGFVVFGQNRPQVWVSSQRGDIKVPSKGSPQIILPRDGFMYILGPSFKFERTTVQVENIAKNWSDYDNWASPILEQIKANTWPRIDTEQTDSASRR